MNNSYLTSLRGNLWPKAYVLFPFLFIAVATSDFGSYILKCQRHDLRETELLKDLDDISGLLAKTEINLYLVGATAPGCLC